MKTNELHFWQRLFYLEIQMMRIGLFLFSLAAILQLYGLSWNEKKSLSLSLFPMKMAFMQEPAARPLSLDF